MGATAPKGATPREEAELSIAQGQPNHRIIIIIMHWLLSAPLCVVDDGFDSCLGHTLMNKIKT